MGKSLVIVESPTKARTISKFLGKDFEVIASYGHVRDLPQSASEIPSRLKKEKWARIGVDIERNFEPLYVIPSDKKKRVDELKALVKTSEQIYLATDEDREGESISWHLLEVLKPKVPVHRLVFHEITKDAIRKALDTPRTIDENLVRAQETRRIVDRLFGYTVSPLLWKKMAPRLSAGRVQSVAIRLLVERERERIRFVSADFSDLSGVFAPEGSKDSFEAALVSVGNKRVASGKDFDPLTGKLSASGDVLLLSHEAAEDLRIRLLRTKPKVSQVEEKPFTQTPYPPFTTSTLQQEASRKLGLPVRRTMQVAQTLYENGFITYMRTDSTNLSAEAIDAAREGIRSQFGAQFLPEQPRIYRTKVKNAQEAHEAIRPAGSTFTPIAEVQTKLGGEASRLYELIWKRTMASQMKDATGTRVAILVSLDDAIFRASGKVIAFPGFLRAYVEGSDDPQAELADKEKILPPLKSGDALVTNELKVLDHSTQPPPRYTEGSLIKELERLGIGRPSTWATIVDVVLSREYAFKKAQALVPTFLATAVTGLLERYFDRVIDYEFTANLEEDLDAISRGEADGLSYLKNFYLGDRPGLEMLVKKGEEVIDPRDVCGIPIGDSNGKKVEVRIGRYGPFLTDGEQRAGLPDSLPPDELSLEKSLTLLTEASRQAESIGTHPESGKPIFLKVGRYGPYVQEGEAGEDESKPNMASLLPGMSLADVNLEVAVQLLGLPRKIGNFPVEDTPLSGEEITAMNGRYGPYIQCGKESRSVPPPLSILTLTLAEAVDLLRRPRAAGRRQAAQSILREVSIHPESGKKIVLKSGRFGPYVTDGETNASLPRGGDPATLTLEEAQALLDARLAYLAANPDRAKGRKKKAATTSSVTKKTARASAQESKVNKTKAKKVTTKKTTSKDSETKKTSVTKSSAASAKKSAKKTTAKGRGKGAGQASSEEAR